MFSLDLKKEHIWFTADLHFNHANIIKYTNRPWTSSQEMDEALVENWNSVITKDDDVFIVGDVAMGGYKSAPYIASILKRLNRRRLFLVPGNHDTFILNDDDCRKNFLVLSSLFEVKISDPLVNNGIQLVTLCHYAMKTWNQAHRGAYMLFGHNHHSMPPDLTMKSIDVGIDGPDYNYRPISYKTVQDILSKHSQPNFTKEES